MLNVVILTGRLTADPELKTTENGVNVCSFSIAVERRYKQGEERQADFINVVAWRTSAEFVSKYFKKGQMIAIRGAIQTRKYTDKDGNKRTVFEVVADEVQFAEFKKADENQGQDPLQTFKNNLGGFADVDIDDNDLPFN